MYLLLWFHLVIKLILHFRNEDPKSANNTTITFYCNPDVINETLSQLETFPYHFTMVTSKVCHPHITQCKVEIDNGKVYNLQPLSKKGLTLNFFVWFIKSLYKKLKVIQISD